MILYSRREKKDTSRFLKISKKLAVIVDEPKMLLAFSSRKHLFANDMNALLTNIVISLSSSNALRI